MADMYQYFYRQKVEEDELNNAFAALEQAERSIVADLGFTGVCSGLAVTQHGTPNLTVDVAAGVAYDLDGQRIAVGVTQNVNVAVDTDGASTTVAVNGNARVVSVFVAFTRALSDPRIDGNAATVYFSHAESFTVRVRMGSEATLGTEVGPALEDDAILLADVRIVYGATSILNASINPYSVNRRQDFDLVTPNAPDLDAFLAAALAAAPTITNAILAGTSTRIATQALRSDGNARGKRYANETDLTTTDATQSSLFTWTILDECITTITAQLSAIKSDGSEYLSAGFRCVIKRDGGTVTVGAVEVFHYQPSTPFEALLFTVDNSGATGRIRITGIAATTISWFAAIMRLEHTHA